MLRISGSGISHLQTRQWPSLLVRNSKLHHQVLFQLFSSIIKKKREIDPPEIKQKNFKRQRFSYNTNKSIARKLQIKGSNKFPFFENPEIQDAIADHAYRRIQIFYYQAVVYYQTTCDITSGRTEIQHGKANHPWSTAAHSSLLTNLNDNLYETIHKKLFEEGLTEKYCQLLKMLGINEDKIQNYKKKKQNALNTALLLRSLKFQKGIIHPNTTLYATMNSTVELPEVVNTYDCIIEKIIRDKALSILNQVSKESVHPYTATQILVKEMDDFFQKSITETTQKIEEIKKVQKLEKELTKLESNITTKNTGIYINKLQEIQAIYQRLGTLKDYSIKKKSEFSLSWRVNIIMMKYKDSLWIVNEVRKNALKNSLKRNRKKILKGLNDSLKIIQLQWNNTRVPPSKSLSRIFIRGDICDITDEQLLQEQLEIIKRD
jgi:hypothetical protein